MLARELLSPPEQDEGVEMQADWLELDAFFSIDKRANIRELLDHFDLEWDQEESEIDSEDVSLADRASTLSAEIQRRHFDLEESYPFMLSGDGFLLSLSRELTVSNCVYLFALLLSHAPSSPLVPHGLAPDGASLQEAREIFEICAVVAAAGITKGPSFCVGTCRSGSLGYLAKLHEVWKHFGDGEPHDTPIPGTPASVNDDGVDVISWWPERDRQPGHGFLVGQAASGNNWKDKSVRPALNRFRAEWFRIQPAAEAHPAIFIPFIVSDQDMRRATETHGYVAHRRRLSRLAAHGQQIASQGNAIVERIGELARVTSWVEKHRERCLALT